MESLFENWRFKCRSKYAGWKVGPLHHTLEFEVISMDKPNGHLSSSPKKCCCTECSNPATLYLEIIEQVQSGYYCNQCSTDLKWHGIAKEKISVYDGVRSQVKD